MSENNTPNPPAESCASCRFALKDDRQLNQWLCRRFPPHPQALAGGGGLTVVPIFPPMQSAGWCGEYVPGVAIAKISTTTAAANDERHQK